MSGLYNELFGHNLATVLVAPMLTDENPGEFFPRFRDCYVEDGDIVIYTRVGGGNRETGFGEERLYDMPTFKETWDDDFDPTYGYYRFGVPEEWRDDFDKVLGNDMEHVSEAYVGRVAKCFGIEDASRLDMSLRRTDSSALGGAPDWQGFFDKLGGE